MIKARQIVLFLALYWCTYHPYLIRAQDKPAGPLLPSSGPEESREPNGEPKNESTSPARDKTEHQSEERDSSSIQTAPDTSKVESDIPSNAQRETTQPDPQFERALPHIEQGEVSFKDGRYEAALAEYERAHEILQGHEKGCELLFNIALCYERLFQYGRAIEFITRYLSECGSDAERRKEALQISDVLEHLLGTLKISINMPAQVWVDDALVGHAPGELLVSGGRHTIELRAEGYESVQLEVSVANREVKELTITLEKISQYEGISPVFVGTTLALGIISAGIGVYFGAEALSESSNAEDHPLNATAKTISNIDDLALTADVFFATAGVLAVASGILFFLTDWNGEATERTSTRSGLSVGLVPNNSRQGAAVNIFGWF